MVAGPEALTNLIHLARTERLKAALDLPRKLRLDALLLMNPANVFYLSGLRATLAYLILTHEKAFLFTDGRYFERAKNLANEYLEVRLVLEKPLETLKKFFRSLRVSSIGIEGDYVTLATRSALKSKFYKLLPLTSTLKELRLKKDKAELEVMKRAVKLTDRIFNELLQENFLGETELGLRARIVEKALRFNANGESFPSIVAYRGNSSIPHWESSPLKIEGKGPLLLDFGILYQGYASDFTRTVHLGRASREFREVYGLVKEAYFRAFSKVRIGVEVREIDLTVRDFFRERGVLAHFTHSTGHGVGVEIHEPPKLYYKNRERTRVEEGMVFTIEPGLYFPGKFGVRLENIVFLEKGEAVVYSEAPLELLEL